MCPTHSLRSHLHTSHVTYDETCSTEGNRRCGLLQQHDNNTEARHKPFFVFAHETIVLQAAALHGWCVLAVSIINSLMVLPPSVNLCIDCMLAFWCTLAGGIRGTFMVCKKILQSQYEVQDIGDAVPPPAITGLAPAPLQPAVAPTVQPQLVPVAA